MKMNPNMIGVFCVKSGSQLFLIFDIKLEDGWILKELCIILSGKICIFPKKDTYIFSQDLFARFYYFKTGNDKYPELLLIEFC